MRLARIETIPLTRAMVLALLNEGVAAIIKNYEDVEIIEGRCGMPRAPDPIGVKVGARIRRGGA